MILGGAIAAFGHAEAWLGDFPGARGRIALAGTLAGVIVLWRRSSPLIVVGLLSVVTWVVVVPDEAHTPVLVANLIAVYSTAAYLPLPAAASGGVVVLSYTAGWIIDRVGGDPLPFSELVFVVVMASGTWVTGRLMRDRREQQTRSEDRAAQLEREVELEAKAAVSDERSRIARELHDVVAHSVSVMVLQAGAAEEVLDREPEHAREALTAIQETGRQAVVELRRLLGVMRRTDEDALLAPQPSLRHVGSLIEQAQQAGLPVTIEVEGTPGSVPPGVDLSAYRIIQEALTNTIKHAGPAQARVLVRYEPDSIEVQVSDTGSGAGTSAVGHGLIGMRESVALYGGTLEVDRGEAAGFTVRARMPIAAGPT